ncbi:MAG: type II toxin-antitoxin system VapC family toxin [Acidimicrobiales bacterium]
MTLVYFDSSALVKLVLNEVGSDVAATLWNASDSALSSRLAYPEVCAALAAAGRNHDLSESETAGAMADWKDFWASIRPIELTPAVEQDAGLLARDHRLRGADAVHLASARALGVTDLTVAVWDRHLHAGAVAAGFAVAPATLG